MGADHRYARPCARGWLVGWLVGWTSVLGLVGWLVGLLVAKVTPCMYTHLLVIEGSPPAKWAGVVVCLRWQNNGWSLVARVFKKSVWGLRTCSDPSRPPPAISPHMTTDASRHFFRRLVLSLCRCVLCLLCFAVCDCTIIHTQVYRYKSFFEKLAAYGYQVRACVRTFVVLRFLVA